MTQRYEKIWFLSDEDVKVLSKWPVMGTLHDNGTLEINAGKLIYTGKNHQLAISELQAFSLFHLIPKTQNWVLGMLITITILAFIISIFFAAIFNDLISIIPTFALALSVGLMFVMFVVCALVWILNFSSKGPYGSTWWVKIDYLDEQNNQQTAYFTDGSWIGWGSILGRTHRMYDNLKQESSTQ